MYELTEALAKDLLRERREAASRHRLANAPRKRPRTWRRALNHQGEVR